MFTTHHIMNVKYALSAGKCWSYCIRKAVDLFSWQKALKNLNINDMIFWWNKMVKNIISNYIPHKTFTFDDRDPHWTNRNLEQLVIEKNKMYKK